MTAPRWLSTLATLVLVTTATLTVLTSPAVADVPSLSGTVTAADTGQPLDGATVTSERLFFSGPDGDFWEDPVEHQTDAAGRYDLELGDGVYRLSYRAAGRARQVYPRGQRIDKATRIVVAGEDRPGLDVQLEPAATLSGHVTGGLSDGQDKVEAMVKDPEDGRWVTISQTQPDQDGNYRFDDLLAGTVRVRLRGVVVDHVTPAHGTVTWKGASRVEDGTDIAVSVGRPTRGIDVVAPAAGRIVGVPRDIEGRVLWRTQVTAYRKAGPDATGKTFWEAVDQTGLNDNGQFLIGGLATGTYRLGFTHPAYSAEFWGDSDDVERGTDISVTAGTTKRGIDPILALPADVSGTVRDAEGEPMSGVGVRTYVKNPSGWQPAGRAETAADGSYTIEKQVAGTYRVGFVPAGASEPSRFYGGATTIEQADDLVVTDLGTEVRHVDAVFGPTGRVAGTITLPADLSRRDEVSRIVQVVDTDTEAVVAQTRGASRSARVLEYSIGGIAPGSYRVEFARVAGRTAVRGQYYPQIDASEGPGGATPVTVEAGVTTDSIDASLQLGGSLSGSLRTVEDLEFVEPTGCPIEVDPIGPGTTRTVLPDMNSGRFTVTGLSAGSYRLVVRPSENGDTARGRPDRCWSISSEPHVYTTRGGRLTTDIGAAESIEMTGGGPVRRIPTLYFEPGPWFSEMVPPTPPTVSGRAAVGGTLEAKIPLPDGAFTTTQQWFRDGVPLDDQTTARHRVTTADAGHELTIEIEYHRMFRFDLALSPPRIRIAVANVRRPVISGRGDVGRRLTVSPGTWAPSKGVKFTYQWLRGSSTIRGATGSTYRTTKADKGRTVTVRVKGTLSGYPSSVATSSGLAVR